MNIAMFHLTSNSRLLFDINEKNCKVIYYYFVVFLRLFNILCISYNLTINKGVMAVGDFIGHLVCIYEGVEVTQLKIN